MPVLFFRLFVRELTPNDLLKPRPLNRKARLNLSLVLAPASQQSSSTRREGRALKGLRFALTVWEVLVLVFQSIGFGFGVPLEVPFPDCTGYCASCSEAALDALKERR